MVKYARGLIGPRLEDYLYPKLEEDLNLPSGEATEATDKYDHIHGRIFICCSACLKPDMNPAKATKGFALIYYQLLGTPGLAQGWAFLCNPVLIRLGPAGKVGLVQSPCQSGLSSRSQTRAGQRFNWQ